MRAHQTENEEIANRCFTEFTQRGRIESEDLRRLFKQTHLKPADQALREEIVFLFYDLCGRSLKSVSQATGLSAQKVLRLVELRTKRLHQTPEGAAREVEREEKLQEKRFEGRVKLIDDCYLGAQDALEKAIKEIPNMTGPHAIRAADIMLKMAERLTELTRSRQSEVGERLLDDDTLETKADEYAQRREKLKLIERGSDSQTA